MAFYWSYLQSSFTNSHLIRTVTPIPNKMTFDFSPQVAYSGPFLHSLALCPGLQLWLLPTSFLQANLAHLKHLTRALISRTLQTTYQIFIFAFYRKLAASLQGSLTIAMSVPARDLFIPFIEFVFIPYTGDKDFIAAAISSLSVTSSKPFMTTVLPLSRSLIFACPLECKCKRDLNARHRDWCCTRPNSSDNILANCFVKTATPFRPLSIKIEYLLYVGMKLKERFLESRKSSCNLSFRPREQILKSITVHLSEEDYLADDVVKRLVRQIRSRRSPNVDDIALENIPHE
ncbi:hypothetical protein GQX74_011364 [Glossina fuscipes]|nr:hypothetical protein GQX74_011364 [Glossina fuscipes]